VAAACDADGLSIRHMFMAQHRDGIEALCRQRQLPMKTFIVASLLLALTTPVPGSELRKKDRAWMETAKDYADLQEECLYRAPPVKENGERLENGEAASCRVSEKLGKKLKANGYCVLGRGIVGRPSRDRKHCYTIAW
jgi:hypothetical protein